LTWASATFSRTRNDAWWLRLHDEQSAGGVLYVGVTADLSRRAWEYREKNLKHWPRTWKVDLIAAANPEWRNLFDEIV